MRGTATRGDTILEFDIETTGLQNYYHEMFSAQFMDSAGNVTTIRTDEHPHPDIQRLLDTAEAEGGIRAWNSKFDFGFAHRAGYTLPDDSLWHDGMLMAHIIDESFSAALKARGEALFGADERGDEQAVKDWSNPKDGNPVRLAIVTGAGNPDCGFERGRIEICNWDLGPTGWSGATWADLDEDGNVVAMRIILNDYYHPEDGQWDREKNRQWVTCHELGHSLGLDHFNQPGVDLDTCMDYSDNVAPNAHDFEQLVEMYGRYRPVPRYWIRIQGVAAK